MSLKPEPIGSVPEETARIAHAAFPKGNSQQAMGEAFKQAIRQREEQRGGCPFCGQQQYRLEGTVRGVIATIFGRVQVPLGPPFWNGLLVGLGSLVLFRPWRWCQ